MAGILENSGYKIKDKKSDAEVIVINICTVKGTRKAMAEIRKTKREYPDKKIVVSGCISKEIKPMINEFDENIVLISTNDLLSIKMAVSKAISNEKAEFLEKINPIKINHARVRANPVIGIIPISSGCNQACAYCTVVLVKGKLDSYNQDAIITEAKTCIDQGCKELWLTSQDTASYLLEKDKISRLPQLLNSLCKIDGDFKIRVGMMNPTFVKPVLKELIESFKNDKIYKFLHIPVQAGSDKILDDMGRGYHIDTFFDIIDAFKREIPEITIASDIILGLPGETEQDFQKTIELVKRLNPTVLHISRFVARPNTRAYYMKNQVHGNLSQKWSQQMTKIFNQIAYDNQKKWLGWQGEILINEIGKKGTDTMGGRNYAYKPIVIHGNFKIGDKLKVKIIDAANMYLIGEVA